LGLDVVPPLPPWTIDRVLSMPVYRAGGSQVNVLTQVLHCFS